MATLPTSRLRVRLFVNKWTHVLFTWDPVATPVLYVDGELVGISYSYNSKHKKKYPVQGRFCIGKTTRVMSKNQGGDIFKIFYFVSRTISLLFVLELVGARSCVSE